MKKILVCLYTIMAITSSTKAQTRYIVQFTDKGSNPYSFSNPLEYLSQKAIDRRNRYSISFDSTDLPVTPRYVDSIRMSGSVTILNVSKWLNSVSIQTTDITAINKINSFPFVQSMTGIAAKIAGEVPVRDKFNKEPSAKNMDIFSDDIDYGFSSGQVRIHNGQFLHNIGLRGQNQVITMLDAGFRSYLSLKAFDSARLNNQIKAVYDFVSKDSSVNEDHSHGMQCFSTIAANIPGEFVGTAPGSDFYLFRSENASSEYPIELHNWVCAAERADSVGTDVISSSLGYNTFDPPLENFDFTYDDMDGNTSMASIGADLAAKKGILVVNSAGNEGTNSWGRIITPADGDSVLAVGAVTADSIAAAFTSRGPSSDGQVKPDVASVGVNATVQLINNSIGTNNGTSFAAPNLAGLATCLWQGFPEFNNMKIIYALRQSGHRAANPNDTVGYGIPDMKKAFMLLLKDYSNASGNAFNCVATLNWMSKDTRNMRYEIERKLPGQSGFLKITEMYGSGNELSSHTYQFTENLTDLPSGAIIYRIRQVIDTNTATFTADFIDTVTVISTISCVTSNQVTLLPNPSRGPLIIKVSTLTGAPDLLIRIFNSNGQLVADMKKSHSARTSFYEIPIYHLASGKYFVSVYVGSELLDTKDLIKL